MCYLCAQLSYQGAACALYHLEVAADDLCVGTQELPIAGKTYGCRFVHSFVHKTAKMADDLQLAEATQPLSFAEFLDRMKDPRAADLVKSIKM